jgi:hypothetical protein
LPRPATRARFVLDHVVDAQRQRLRDRREAERLRRLQVDDQLERRWLLNGKIALRHPQILGHSD